MSAGLGQPSSTRPLADRRPPSTGPADPFALTTDFPQLLGGRDG
ncbi:hypothetical protein [Micromonospora sp. DT47]